MPELPNISDAEWRVMQVLWNDSPLLGSEVAKRLKQETDWSLRTVKTMLGRLVAKGALKYRQEGKSYLYRPAVKKEACVKSESRSFLDRVFNGDTSLMLTHLVDSKRLSQKDIEALKTILNKKG